MKLPMHWAGGPNIYASVIHGYCKQISRTCEFKVVLVHGSKIRPSLLIPINRKTLSVSFITKDVMVMLFSLY